MIGHLLAVLALGTAVGMDLASVGQFMIARPLVAGTLAGWMLGDPLAGVTVGVMLELFALDVMPMGAVRYPDYGVGAVVAAATAAGTPNPLGIGVAVTLGLFVALAGEFTIVLLRRRNSRDVRRHAAALEAGDRGVIRALQWRGVSRDALRSVLLTGVGLAVGLTMRLVPPVTLRGAVFLAVAIVGAAIGTAGAGVMRLSGRGLRLKWLALGLAGGSAWVFVA